MGRPYLLFKKLLGMTRSVFYRYLQGRILSGRTSFSQCGEDMIVDYIFRLKGIEFPSYLDVGANHPYHLNNTAFFYLKGSRGVNVEANAQMIRELKLYRKRDVNIHCGVGTREGETLEFYIMDDPTLSTFSKKEVELLRGHHVAETVSVTTHTLNYLIGEHFSSAPDFLSVDVEGRDFDIIKTLDFINHRPKVVCIESYGYSPAGMGQYDKKLAEFFLLNGYHEYANTGLNSIFVDKKIWFAVP